MLTARRLLTLTATGARALSAVTKLSTNNCFGGQWRRFQFDSSTCGTPMVFSVFVPPVEKAPCLFYLSGLTCTDENFVQKAGAARRAAQLGIALVAPDTSPRLPDDRKLPGEDDAYDFGSGAGFYVDATNYPWSQYYNMYAFVTQELPEAVMVACPEVDVQTRSITGHSMGGHGALTIALKQPAVWRSVSAFSPICNPTKVPWGPRRRDTQPVRQARWVTGLIHTGQKAFEGYLGSVEAGLEHDACELVKKAPRSDAILVSQGADDDFLVGDVNQLQPEAFRSACDSVGQELDLRYEAGYDHSYFFIQSFIDEHIDFHAARLK